MRYEYTVTKEGGEAELMKEMSWKKLFKKLLVKYPKFSGWCTYINKKGQYTSERHSVMGNLFTNEKETKRAIKAAVDQYEIHRRYTLAKHKRSRKNRAKNKRAKLRGDS